MTDKSEEELLEEVLSRLNVSPDPEATAQAGPRIVKGAGRGQMEVMNQMEEDWLTEAIAQYQSQYNFQNVADLDDLDRLLATELLSMRYSYWLLSGKDYWGKEFVVKAVAEQKDKIDTQIRQLKRHMGIDRKGRVESEQESVSEYLKNLLQRSKEFGVHRDEQIALAIDLFMELRKMIGLHDRSNEEERSHLGVNVEDIINWIREVAIPEFDKVDEAFRKNQRLWIKEIS